MMDFLSNLVERSFGTAVAIRPRLAFLFEPAFPHAEPPADVSPLSGIDSPGAQEREPARAAFERREEPAPKRGIAHSRESGERTSRGPAVPGAHSEGPALPLLPAPATRMTRAPFEEETKRPQAESSRDSPQDKASQVVRRRDAARPIQSDNGSRPESAEIGAAPKAFGRRDDERGLLVPSKLAVRIAGDLQSSVSAASVTPQTRRDALRGAESDHSHAERNVHVTIGRIDVRATSGEKAAARERPTTPVMGLDEYLRRQARRGGE
jgi:hypothetical protein